MPALCWVGVVWRKPAKGGDVKALVPGSVCAARSAPPCSPRTLLLCLPAVWQSPAFRLPPILCAWEAPSFAWEERPWKQGWISAGENELTRSLVCFRAEPPRVPQAGAARAGAAAQPALPARAAVWKWGMLGSAAIPAPGLRGSRRQRAAPGAGPWR